MADLHRRRHVAAVRRLTGSQLAQALQRVRMLSATG
jgi:hypothetical protein